ncbi:MAG: NAD(P)-dependent glycerol-3-phosphate dehydrogenase [Gallionellaceae bacterium]|jgi:glycerol-3-phosphate dehydrogenase (NAD(P)+)|nr:NAD(P)-dependent glycerol-3-phosphate dehydrogenase [Gallionellaceae bacterium]
MNITVIGAGAWGTALAISLAAHHRVTLWARDAAQIGAMRTARCNQRYLPDIPLPANLELSADFPVSLADADLAIIAVPTAALRTILQQFAQCRSSGRIRAGIGLIWLCKGFEAETAQLPHQVVAEVLPDGISCGVLSGPSFAQEVARGLPTALTLASSNEEFARNTAHALHHAYLRIYASTDVAGVEVGGAVKNVLAIAAGVCDGMGLGHNARAALLTRGLAEITRLGLKLGGRPETLGGLSGAGDLILTCTGDLSRNRQVGLLLAQQHDLPEILRRLRHVAEGVYTVREVHRLAQRTGVAMPICEAVYRILYEHVPAADAVAELLNRAPNLEFNQ